MDINEEIIVVNFSVVSGGAALVAGSLVAGSGTLTPALALIFGNYIIPLNAILIFSIYNCRLWRDPIRRKYVGTEHVSRYCCCSSHKGSNSIYRTRVLQNSKGSVLHHSGQKRICSMSSLMS